MPRAIFGREWFDGHRCNVFEWKPVSCSAVPCHSLGGQVSLILRKFRQPCHVPFGSWFAVDTVIAVKWNFYCFVSRWHKSVLEVRAAASSPRATARPFGQRGLTPPPASNQGPACDRRLDVAQQPIANAGSKGLPVFRTPKHRTNNLRIAATTICLGLSRPRAFNRVTSATIAGLYRIADIAGM